MKINWQNIPIYNIDCSKLTSPRDIIIFMEQNNIFNYVYKIDVIKDSKLYCAKIGMSADKSRDKGERLYRQIAHLKSWRKQRILGPSGADFVIVEELFKKRHKFNINHKNCKLTIYDMTKYSFISFNVRDEILAVEETLIYEHEKKYGNKPVGNLLDSYSNRDKAVVEKMHFNKLFEY